jgi:hypothetical protein
MKLLKLCVIVSFVLLSDNYVKSATDPIYESPVIVKNNGFSSIYNPRIDALNNSSAKNYERYLSKKLRNRTQNDLLKHFSIENYDKWLSVYETENLNEKVVPELIESVGTILGKSIDLQNYINFKSNLIIKKLALLDVKIKQIKVLDQATQSIEQHPGDINSNSPSNALWKDSIDTIIETIGTSQSEYNIAFNSICSILGTSKEQLKKEIPDSKAIRNTDEESIYYPKNKSISTRSSNMPLIVVPDNVPVRDEKTLLQGLKILKEKKILGQNKTFRFKSELNNESKKRKRRFYF